MVRWTIAFLILVGSVWATTFYVNASTGSNSNTCTQAQSPSTPKDTIAHGISCIGTADTVTVYAGTYTESPTITAGAGSGSYNTINVHSTDVVTVVGTFTLNSHTQLVGNCAVPTPQTAGTCGFTIQNPSAPTTGCISLPTNATDIFITNNIITQCGSGAQVNGSGGGLSKIYIENNTFSYAGIQSGVGVTTTTSATFNANASSIQVNAIGGAQSGGTSSGWVVYGNGLTITNGIRISSITGTGPYTLNLVPVSATNCTTPANSCTNATESSGTTIQLNPATTNCIVLVGSGTGLISGNDFSHYTLCLDTNFPNLITQNNNFHDVFQYEGGGNSHTDAWFCEPGAGNNCFNTLIEGNTIRNTNGPDAKAFLAQNDGGGACGTCANLIQRFNVINRIGGGLNSPNTANDFPYIKTYSNTFVDTVADDSLSSIGDIDNSESQSHAAKLNNIYYFGASATWGSSGYYVYGVGSNSNTGYDLFFCAAGGSCPVVDRNINGSGFSFASDATNITADPKFSSYVSPGSTSNNFRLLLGSPAIAAGKSLTTVSSATGSGSSITVADAGYFQDGLGMTAQGINADCISVTTVLNHVCVTAVNYATNVLTLATSISWTVGDPVWLYSKSDGVQVLTGSAPDLGAYPYVPLNGAPTPAALFAKAEQMGDYHKVNNTRRKQCSELYYSCSRSY